MPHRTYLPKPDRWKAVAIPAGAAVVLISALACILIAFSVREANELVIKRDHRLAASVLQQAVAQVAHDQESVTAWDDAVLHLRAGASPDWLDDNLGVWLNMYFGHERVVVLDPADKPIYASVGSRRADPEAFADIAPNARPLIAELRKVIAEGRWFSPSPKVRSPGAQEIVVVDGHPAMLSVKPVVPSTSKIHQTPAEIFLHITVRYLDGSFLDELRSRYMFEGARFSWSDRPEKTELSFPLLDRQQRPVGFLVWQVHLPGQVLAARLTPALIATLLAILLIVAVLAASLRRGADALRASEARARYLAFHDALTGLPNRACFNQALTQVCQTGNEDVTLLLMDLDRFKQVNDTFGHPAGDELLRVVGARLKSSSPSDALIARLGGDEFAVLLKNVAFPDVMELGQALIDSVTAPVPIHNVPVTVGVSIGLATLADAKSQDVFVKRADMALYTAKRLGGGLHVAEPDEDSSAIAA